MEDLLTLSSRILDQGVADQPVNRISQELSELREDLAIVESFSHVITFRTEEGLVAFDTSLRGTAAAVLRAIRGWSSAPFHSLVYTHGHLDHVGGAGAFVAEAEREGHAKPRVLGHENVKRRLERYRATSGYNLAINARQFGGLKGAMANVRLGEGSDFVPPDTPSPDLSFEDQLHVQVGGLEIELNHARGETDDHLWAWLPAQRTICAGDFFIWNFPNAGNPQKVQRYPVEWAQALREMSARGAELFVPAHGLPIEGVDRIARVLGEVADTLEDIVAQTLEAMNAGESLDRVLQAVKIAPATLERPYLRPLYDEPEFVVRNIWRLYGGWYDGNPARLKPAPESELARELCALVGGVGALVNRARELAELQQWRLACHLIELAVQALPEDRAAHVARAEIYSLRRRQEASLMAKGIFASAVRESEAWGSKTPHRD